MVTQQFFSPGIRIYLRSQCLMLWSSCSVQPLVVPTGKKMVFLAMKSATVCESARNRWKSSHSNRSKAVLVLSDIFGGVLHCFGVFWTISGIVFKVNILSTDYFFKWQVSFRPFPRQLQRRSGIGYEYWKWSALRNITSLACVPLEQARMDSTKVTNYKKKII